MEKETKKKALDVIQEKQQVEENKLIEKERRAHDIVRRADLKKSHANDKRRKREVNIEIASGLVDLLMDMQDETFQIM